MPSVHWILPCLLLCSLAVSARDLDQDEALRLRQSGTIRPVAELMQAALQRHPAARLLEVELEEGRGRYVYEFELLTADGLVRELEFDAATGQLLKDREDD